MKQRFSSLDVKVIAHELSNTLTSLRVSNIYDLSSKIFLVKFAKPDHKEQFIVDSGFRCHLTEFARTTAAAPSLFVGRLRKFLKTRRVTSVSQVGTDRIIEFQFSEGQYKLYLEFYAGGNVILTDKELNILALLRAVSEGEGQEQLRVGLQYSLENRQNYGGIPLLTKERLQSALSKAVERGDDILVAGKKPKKKTNDGLRKALAVSITEYPPMLVDHAMRVTEFDSSLKPAEVLASEELIDHLLRSLEEAKRVVQEITSSEISKGYIIAKRASQERTTEDNESNSRHGLLYDDFHPFRPRQFENEPALTFLEINGFNKAVDEFFSSIEGQKLESRLQDREANAKKKLEAARQDQAKRLGGLHEIQELNECKASALQANSERVQEAINAVNSLIAQAMDWVEIGKLVELEQKRKNPVASLIKLPLKLHENTITLLLNEEELIDDDEFKYETDSDISDSDVEGSIQTKDTQSTAKDNRLVIDVNLSLSPWSNAREYFGQRKSAAIKEHKTLQSSMKALKSHEAKIAQDLKKGLKQEKAVLRPVRRQLWFESMIWFKSSDGYLVLGAADAQRQELLYKRYLKRGDIYLHAELPAAAMVVVRNNPKTPNAPIPPSTLIQAGTMVVSCSSAWDSKAGMSAWWVHADQVSKSAPGGGFLPAGSFSITGSKNFLPPAQLVLGFGIMFQISDASKAKHTKHRVQEDTENEDVDGDVASVHAAETADEDSDDEEIPEQDDVKLGEVPVEASVNEEDNDKDDDDPTVPTNPLQGDSQEQHTSVDGNGIQEFRGLSISVDQASAILNEGEGELKHEDGGYSPTESEAPSTFSTSKSYKGSVSQKTVTQQGPKRGQRGKAKKIAQKYKDQDEEDRIAAAKLIGSAVGAQRAAEEAKVKAEHEAELAFQKERRKAQHARAQEEIAVHEIARKAMLENKTGNEDADDDDEATAGHKVGIIDSLVGQPLAGDEILEAIAVCAPWSAMGNFKYKVKLQPGTVKKGKAVKEIVGRWAAATAVKAYVDERALDRERIWPRERDLIQAWKVEECINTVPVGKVRVVLSGGSVQSGKAGGGSAAKSNKGGSGGGGKGKKGR